MKANVEILINIGESYVAFSNLVYLINTRGHLRSIAFNSCPGEFSNPFNRQRLFKIHLKIKFGQKYVS